MDTFAHHRRTGINILLTVFFMLSVLVQVSSAAVVDVYLRADAFTVTMPDGQVIPMWGFVQTDNTYTPLPGQVPAVPGPQIDAMAGDTVNIHLLNNLTGLYTEPVSLHIPGQIAVTAPTWNDGSTGNRTSLTQRVRSFAHEAAQGGGTATYTWSNLKSGTYLYQSATHPAVQVQMGLYGILEVNAAAGPPAQAYDTDTAYDVDLALVFSEIDPALHTAVAAGTYGVNPASTIHYNPKYFLINGKPFTYGESAIPIGTPSQTTLLRFLNAGLDDHVPVFQGLYLKIVAEDGKLYPYPKYQYSVHIPAGKTVDALLSPSPEGYYPLYDRRLYLTNAAASPGGMLRYLVVQSAAQHLLTVTLAGTGTGKVELVSLPGGISCGMGNTDCTEVINNGTTVVLSATAAAASTFGGWSGACTGTGTCTVVMDAAKSVTATFNGGVGSSISGNAATSGGAPIAGVTMTLTGAASATTTTDASGNYTFAGLANGSYTVTPTLAGYTFTPANRAVTISGANVTGQNFTGIPVTYSISGNAATSGGAPIAGVTMTLTGAASATTTTDASGNYTFAGLANGSYTVTPTLAGYTFTPANRAVTISGANVTGQNFTGTALSATYSISGNAATSGGAPIAGVTMTLTGAASATTTTDASGSYSFAGLANGAYTVTPGLTGYSFTPVNRNVTINNANVTGQNFTGIPVTYSISGNAATSGGAPIAGVTMTLTGAASATTTTDASGNYTFAGLANGVYTITPNLTGYSFIPVSRNVTISGANVTGQNFTGSAAATYFIRGYVKDSNGRRMSGVTMRLTGAATMTILTNATGDYQFSGLLPGTYTVTPVKTGYVFSPVSRTATITNQNITGQEFEGKISSTPQ